MKILSVTLLTFALSASALEYQVTYIGRLPGHIMARSSAVNDLGHVCGFSDNRAFFWSPENGMVELPPLAPRTDAIAYDLNNSDVVAGTSGIDFAGPNSNRAVRWTNGIVEDLGTLPGGSRSQGFGINDSGWVVGYGHYFQAGSEYWRPTLYRDGFGMTILDGVTGGYAYDVSNTGVVVGVTSGGSYTWTVAGGVTMLGAPAGWGSTSAYGISKDGNWVAGNVMSASGNLIQLARWSAGTGWQNYASVNNSGFVSINNHGDCVGSGSGFATYFYTDSLGSHDVNLYIDPASGWVINTVADINESGQIAASGQNTITFEAGALLLTPVVASTLPPIENLTTAWDGDSLHFRWASMPGATLYRLYGSTSQPVTTTPENQITTSTSNSITILPGTEEMKFFVVTWED